MSLVVNPYFFWARIRHATISKYFKSLASKPISEDLISCKAQSIKAIQQKIETNLSLPFKVQFPYCGSKTFKILNVPERV